jgi:hypothetical protein
MDMVRYAHETEKRRGGETVIDPCSPIPRFTDSPVQGDYR